MNTRQNLSNQELTLVPLVFYNAQFDFVDTTYHATWDKNPRQEHQLFSLDIEEGITRWHFADETQGHFTLDRYLRAYPGYNLIESLNHLTLQGLFNGVHCCWSRSTSHWVYSNNRPLPIGEYAP